MLERQKHPFQPYIPKNALAVIIGTAPPWNLCCQDLQQLREGEIAFFYGSIHNLFWYVMKAVFDPDNSRWPRNRAQCESLLKRWNLGIGDILQSFVRQNRKAADDHLTDFTFNTRLLAKIHSSPGIRHLYFTGHFACDLYLKALKQNKYVYHVQREDRKSFLLYVQHKEKSSYFNCYIVNSPSPRINRSLDEMVEDYRQKFAPIIESTQKSL